MEWNVPGGVENNSGFMQFVQDVPDQVDIATEQHPDRDVELRSDVSTTATVLLRSSQSYDRKWSSS
jgi:hypothetical protein